MNNIGFAATKSTAATNNNTATQNTGNLSSLASSFTNSTSLANGSNFNNLIISLLTQIIQTLLRNVHNKPCCDQPPKPTEKPLDLSDTQLNKLDKLPSLGKREPGSDPTIKSVIDTDGNNQLSVGDKVNLEQVTDQLDANGQATIKTSTKVLTANDLAIYNSLKAPSQLSDAATEQAQFAINQLGAVESNGTSQATGGYYDNDADGKLSVGDQVEALLFTDDSGAPTPDGAYRVTRKTVDEAFLENYNKPLILSDVQKGKLEDALFFGINFVGGNVPRITSIEDSDKSGSLSVGDKVNFEQWTGQVDDQGNVILRYTSSEITQEVLDRYGNTNIVNSLPLSAEQIANMNSNDTFSSFSFDPKTDAITDTNKDGKLSAGDTISGTYMPIFSFDGISGPTEIWANTLTEGDVNAINGDNGKILISSKLENNEEILHRIEQALRIREAGVVSNEYVKAVFDKNADNQLSAGDIVVVNASFSQGAISGEPLPVLPKQYIELTQEQIDQIKPDTMTGV